MDLENQNSNATNPNRSPRGFNWNEHPVIIASGSAVAGFLLCLGIFTQMVVPVQLGKIELEVITAKESLAKSIAAQKALEEEKNSGKASMAILSKELEELKSIRKDLEIELVEAKAANLFIQGNPYPNGLGLVRIGMDKSEIQSAYPDHEIEISGDDPNIVSVKLKNSPFDRVTYYLQEDGKGLISHVSFYMGIDNKRYSEEFVYRKLVENFGVPEVRGKRYFKWTVGDTYSLFAHSKNGYVLTPIGISPLFWD